MHKTFYYNIILSFHSPNFSGRKHGSYRSR